MKPAIKCEGTTPLGHHVIFEHCAFYASENGARLFIPHNLAPTFISDMVRMMEPKTEKIPTAEIRNAMLVSAEPEYVGATS